MRGGEHDTSRYRMFPVGLYGVLLFGLFGVTFPELVAPLESAARTVVTLPLRAYSILLGAQPAQAASHPGARIGLPGQDRSVLEGRVGPPGHTPRVCRVVARQVGPLGVVDELTLAVRVGELRGSAALVTSGSTLLGFLHLPEPGTAEGERELARVRLLTYRTRYRERRDRPLQARPPTRLARVPAQVACREADAQGVLHFVVEPARAVDHWPLRCSLLDDSYLGSRMRSGGDLVTTAAAEDPMLPKGLAIGRLMIWGYPEHEVPIGMFVEPTVDPRSVSSVVVWEPGDGSAAVAEGPGGELLPVRFTRFPAPRPAGERWMVTASAGLLLPDGAAVVDRGRLLGRLHRPWSGQSLVSPFAASTRPWSLLLRSADGRVHELVGRVGGRDERGRLQILLLGPPTGVRLAGDLFTGVNGPHCPAGFRIGRAVPGRFVERAERTPMTTAGGRDPVHGELWLSLPAAEVVDPQVYVGAESPGGDR